MGEVNLLVEAVQAPQMKQGAAANKNQGTLKTPNGEHTVDVFSNTEVLSEDISQFLSEQQETNEKSTLPEMTLIEGEEVLQTQEEIDTLLEELAMQEEAAPSSTRGEKTEQQPTHFQARSERTAQKESAQVSMKSTRSNTQPTKLASSSKIIYPDLFSLARSSLSKTAKGAEPTTKKMDTSKPNQNDPRAVRQGHSPSSAAKQQETFTINHRDNAYEEDQDQEGSKKQQEEGSGQQQNQDQQQQRQDEKKQKKITRVETSQSSENSSKGGATRTLNGIGNIYIRFMALMARILGQAEAEAHQLYLRIKERTDNIDTLTHFISKINSTEGKIDWSKDEEMKQLVEKVRSLGVDIPEGKYQWSEDEKRLLKENVQMRKDSMEKVTQLERTDMQRYLQEASQCHQARSNVLKLLKEVMDTIVHNMRP